MPLVDPLKEGIKPARRPSQLAQEHVVVGKPARKEDAEIAPFPGASRSEDACTSEDAEGGNQSNRTQEPQSMSGSNPIVEAKRGVLTQCHHLLFVCSRCVLSPPFLSRQEVHQRLSGLRVWLEAQSAVCAMYERLAVFAAPWCCSSNSTGSSLVGCLAVGGSSADGSARRTTEAMSRSSDKALLPGPRTLECAHVLRFVGVVLAPRQSIA
ncbi:hypothetical protein PG994_004164 [Apiospora phragmitis]|uniref:Uncharacterized protein n=1 Tax=Apiospora phragmitis TaxID=2905665 RepID=A0ABR1VSY0_9PEZI